MKHFLTVLLVPFIMVVLVELWGCSTPNTDAGAQKIGGNEKSALTTARKSADTSKTVSVIDNRNPHWDKSRCNECHGQPGKNDKLNLHSVDDKLLCLRCHQEDVIHKYIHPVGLKMSDEMEKRVAKNWKDGISRDATGRLTCVTCHDLLNQCLDDRFYMSKLNKNFLREGPYTNRSTICFKCHNKKKYERMNSHRQISADGNVILEKCRLCHEVQVNKTIKSGIQRDLSKFPLIANLNSDRTLLCIRCHKKIDHPTSALKVTSINEYRHLVPITEDKMSTLRKKKKATGIVMPLEPDTNRIYCGTCHEPHQPGLFVDDKLNKKGSVQHRLRDENICIYCHNK